jgi:AcrR family transcriptional regulator
VNAPSTRERILLASGQVILARGVREASVKDILRVAGLSRRTFYQHFKSKDAAFEALYRQEGTDRLYHAMVEAMASTDDPGAKVLTGVDAFLLFEQTGGVLLAKLQSEALHPESALHPARLEVFGRLVGLVADTVEHSLGIAFDPDLFRAVFLGIEGLLIEQLREGELSEDNLNRLRKMMRAILIGIFMNAPHLPRA